MPVRNSETMWKESTSHHNGRLALSIGGYSLLEIRGYLEKNQEEYLNRFRQIDRKRKFNGAAAFLGSLWLMALQAT